MDDSHPERKISLQLQLYIEVVGRPSFDMELFRCNFLSIHQLHITYTFALCAMLTFKSVQTADEKINELWEFDPVAGRGGGFSVLSA